MLNPTWPLKQTTHQTRGNLREENPPALYNDLKISSCFTGKCFLIIYLWYYSVKISNVSLLFSRNVLHNLCQSRIYLQGKRCDFIVRVSSYTQILFLATSTGYDQVSTWYLLSQWGLWLTWLLPCYIMSNDRIPASCRSRS